MKLGFDARMLLGEWKHRGIGRYIISLLKHVDDKNIVAYFPKNNISNEYKFFSKGHSFFPFWEQIILPQLISSNNLEFFLFPSITAPFRKFSNTKTIVIVYDLIFMLPFAELKPSHSLYNNLGRLYRRLIAPLVYIKCDFIIAISEYSKNELSNTFKISKDRIFVIPCSITNDWFINKPIPSHDRKKYFLAVSGDAPSKNLFNIIEAFSFFFKLIDDKSFILRIVGVKSSSQRHFIKFAKKLNIENNVIFDKLIKNSELQSLYRNAWCSLTLSLHEGFGVPIVEAMASGTPVICSNSTSMPEVAGDNAIFADPKNISDIVNSMVKIYNMSAIDRDDIASKALVDSHRYSESSVEKEIINFWSKLGLN
jgi:glycosyltransferase involved in cell wall biosynthesis